MPTRPPFRWWLGFPGVRRFWEDVAFGFTETSREFLKEEFAIVPPHDQPLIDRIAAAGVATAAPSPS